jgi:PhnB protein
MSIQKLNPYINFNGDAATAIALYERTLGAKVERLMRFGELPDMPPQHKDRIMHAELRLGEATLMLSDGQADHPVKTGSCSHVCLHFGDAKDMQQKFEALSSGGEVSYPIHDAFFGAKFGMLVDAVGVQWMFICENKA